LVIRVLGELEIVRDGKSLALPKSRRTRALLAFLVLTRRRHRRERLCELLWEVPDDPRGALRWSLSKIRPLVNEPDCERLVATREHVAFEPRGADVDLTSIRQAFVAKEALSVGAIEELLARFRGELLEGLDVPDQPAFGAWLLAEREAARRTRAALLRTLIERLREDPERALPHVRALTSVEPHEPSAHASLLGCLVAASRREEAARQYELSTVILDEAGFDAREDLELALEAPWSRRIPERGTPLRTAPVLRQEIRFCTAPDGVRIAYATVGSGPPLVKAANWLNHLEFDWESPVWRHVFRALGSDRCFVRYDERGNGLSDWDAEDLSFESFVHDLESVVDAVGLERFPLLGISQGCAVCVEYAVRHPERVSHLILHGGYARGWAVEADPEEIQRREAMMTLTLYGWGQENPSYRQLFTNSFIPGGTPEQLRWFNDLQRTTTSPANAARFQKAFSTIDVRDRLPRVQVPTLVLHGRGDLRVEISRGKELARGIPGARFVTLESDNHLLLEHDPAWPRFLEEVRAFLVEGDPAP